jgi:hypothetical protein
LAAFPRKAGFRIDLNYIKVHHGAAQIELLILPYGRMLLSRPRPAFVEHLFYYKI